MVAKLSGEVFSPTRCGAPVQAIAVAHKIFRPEGLSYSGSYKHAQMLIREYQEKDLSALRAIHAAQGFDYALPDLSNPLFVTKLVLAQKEVAPGLSPAAIAAPAISPDAALIGGATNSQPDHILGAVLLRLTAEAYLLLDPRAGTPRERWHWLLALHAAAERDAWQRGLEDVHAWLPPPIAKKFGKRVARLGWLRDDAWTPYCKKLAVRE